MKTRALCIRRGQVIFLVLLTASFVVADSHAQGVTLDWDAFSTGATTAQDGNKVLLMTIGQNVVENASGGSIVLASGFFAHPLISGTAVSVDDENVLPKVFALQQNYPNPFNPSTLIRFSLPKESHVRLAIYNLLGQEIIVLVDDNRAPGYYTVSWHGVNRYQRQVSAGVYFYRIEAHPADGDPFVRLKKMILVK